MIWQGLLWCSSIHHGEWCQGLWGCCIWKATWSARQVHEVCRWSDDPQWRTNQSLCRYCHQTCLPQAGYAHIIHCIFKMVPNYLFNGFPWKFDDLKTSMPWATISYLHKPVADSRQKCDLISFTCTYSIVSIEANFFGHGGQKVKQNFNQYILAINRFPTKVC